MTETYTDELTDRDHAILWARNILKTDFVVLDTETTGLDDEAEACQIGIVNRAGEILLDQLVKPRQPIPGGATRLHGITSAMVQHAPGFETILPEIGLAVAGKTILIYNREYDQRILLQSAQAAGVEFEAWWWPPRDWRGQTPTELHPRQKRWHCVMERFAEFYGDWNDWKGSYTWQRLTKAAAYFNIPTDGAHGAVADALMTLRVVEEMAKARLKTRR